jgi:hypothetical protein
MQCQAGRATELRGSGDFGAQTQSIVLKKTDEMMTATIRSMQGSGHLVSICMTGGHVTCGPIILKPLLRHNGNYMYQLLFNIKRTINLYLYRVFMCFHKRH